MTSESTARSVGKGILGVGLGLGLYYLFRRLCLDSGGNFREGGRGGESLPPATSRAPEAPPGPSTIPSVSRDDTPLLFWVLHPAGLKESSRLPSPTARARVDARFRHLDLGEAQFPLEGLRARVREILRREESSPPMSLDDVVSRVAAGGRDDVRLMTSGGIRQGTWDDVRDALMAAGIKHWGLWHEWPSDRRPGDPSKPPRWELHDKITAAGNPDANGHYSFRNAGTAYWNLEVPREAVGAVSPHRRSSQRGRGCYQ